MSRPRRPPPPLADDEIALFREAVRDVVPLRHDRVPPMPLRPAPVPHMTRRDEREVIRDLLSDDYHPDEMDSGEEIWFARPGVQHHVMRKLRRGHYSVGAELDLHGMTVPIARETLAGFLWHCLDHGVRCARIIHGKGRRSSQSGPVLKGKVDRWLRRRDEVLAFCSARPVDGGTGAVYVLLRRG